jgi:hypothetical protein
MAPATWVPLAHETRFDFPEDWGLAGRGLSLALLGSAIVVTLRVGLLSRRWPGANVPPE